MVITIDGSQTQSSKRRAQYVSPATQSMSVNVTLQGGTTSIAGFPQTVNLTSTSNGCVSTLASTQCTLTINVPPGSFDATLTTYDGTNATGNVLSAAQSVPFVVTAGAANRLAIILGGVPTSARIIADSPTITGDPSTGFTLAGGASATVTVVGVDADGNFILGVGAPSVTLTSTDTSQYTVSGPTAAAPNRFTVTNVAGTVANATLNATVTPSAQSGGNAASTSAKISSALVATLTALSSSYAVIGETVTETLSGTNFTPGSTVHVSGGLVTVQNVTFNSATSLTATFVVDPSAAQTTRNVIVTTDNGATAAQPFTILSLANVILTTDTASGTASDGSVIGVGPGSPGDLRYAMLHVAAGTTISFSHCDSPCTIVLKGPLPPITQNLTIDGGSFGTTVIDGSGLYRAFFVDAGTVLLQNLTVQNTKAKGGDGGRYTGDVGGAGGGGGAGLGAGLFVNQAGAAVTVANVYLLNCAAAGGAGKNQLILISNGENNGGGGGGLYGAGGLAVSSGSAGGGVLGWGGDSNNPAGGIGGGAGVPGGVGYAGNSAGGRFNGGFGGGGSGGDDITAHNGGGGGAGGFGGGGGGGPADDPSVAHAGGNGGPGGGGGGGHANAALAVGGALATVTGGNGGLSGDGGGGAAAGPAIFVNAGTLTTSNSGAGSVSATGGQTSGTATPGTADATPVFNYAGTVNGSTAIGPVPTALSGSMPMSVQRRVH